MSTFKEYLEAEAACKEAVRSVIPVLSIERGGK